ncbi:MAG: transposase [Coriobacteriaceae bacterium]
MQRHLRNSAIASSGRDSAKLVLHDLNSELEKAGITARGGSIVDATFIEAPSSTKNKDHVRDPEAHQSKKGKNWHFGYKAHIGVDAGSGLVHAVETTAANVSDISQAHALVREDDRFCYADSGYTGIAKRPEVTADPHLSSMR